MSVVLLTKWGNSIGVRIPKDAIKKARAHVGEKFEIKTDQKGGFTLQPVNDPQKGWTKAFNAIADSGQEDDLLGSFESDFDKEDWTW